MGYYELAGPGGVLFRLPDTYDVANNPRSSAPVFGEAFAFGDWFGVRTGAGPTESLGGPLLLKAYRDGKLTKRVNAVAWEHTVRTQTTIARRSIEVFDVVTLMEFADGGRWLDEGRMIVEHDKLRLYGADLTPSYRTTYSVAAAAQKHFDTASKRLGDARLSWLGPMNLDTASEFLMDADAAREKREAARLAQLVSASPLDLTPEELAERVKLGRRTA